MNMMRKVLTACVASLALVGYAAAEGKIPLAGETKAVVYNASKGYVKMIVSYEEFGAGDVVFTIDAPIPNCYGLWMKSSDPGFKSNLELLMAARINGIAIHAHALDDKIWPGSTTRYCQVHAITM